MKYTNRRLAWQLYRLGFIDTPTPAKAVRAMDAVRNFFAGLAKLFGDFVRDVKRGLDQVAEWLAPFAKRLAEEKAGVEWVEAA